MQTTKEKKTKMNEYEYQNYMYSKWIKKRADRMIEMGKEFVNEIFKNNN